MDVIIHSEGDKYVKLKETLLADDTINRASIIFKDAKQYGKDNGYLCIISGDEERCEKAIEIAKEGDLGTEITGEEKEVILSKVKEEGNKASEGFGSIFG